MTYGVERMTFQGRTLHEKLRAQYGDRTAQSVSRGLEANSKKKAAREAAKRAGAAKNMESAAHSRKNGHKTSAAARQRSMTSVMRTVRSGAADVAHRQDAGARRESVHTAVCRPSAAQSVPRAAAPRARVDAQSVPRAAAPRAHVDAQSMYRAVAPRARVDAQSMYRAAAPRVDAQSVPRSNARSAQAERRYEMPRHSRPASAREMYETRNPYRVRVNYFKKPLDGRSDLEVSIATFARAYRAGMRAQRAMGVGVLRDRSAEHASVRRGYRRGDVRSDRSAYENSVGVMANAYRRGERMRQITQIEKSKPTAKTEDDTGLSHRLLARLRTILGVKGNHTAELRLKKTPFPIGTVALMAVCTLVVMVMISSFAALSECRAQISDLEYRQDKLALDRSRLTGLVESREDIRVIEKIATKDIGMVSAELAKGRFVSLADCDRVEVIEDAPKEESGVFATILSAISENLGTISEYIN